MGRFSPDTWIDAIQLPLAMVQFKGNVYVEPIAPDIRPIAFLLLTITACVVVGCRRVSSSYRLTGVAIPVSKRGAWALIAATTLALVAWIISSGNGRYGLLAITLCPLASLAALIIAVPSGKIRCLILATVMFVQAIFMLTADPDDTWSKLTPYHWTEESADVLPSEVISKWRTLAESRSVLLVTTKTLTGMSTLYQVFGPKARYMGLGYIDQFGMDTVEYKRSMELVKAADSIYLSRAIAARSKKNNSEISIENPVNYSEKKLLSRFGLGVQVTEKCFLLPERMGAQLQICPLVSTKVDSSDFLEILPKKPVNVLYELAKKCPRIFGDFRVPLVDDLGGIFTNTQDGKYFVEVTGGLDIYIRHRSEVEHRLLLSGGQFNMLKNYSCGALVNSGMQYWH